VDVLPAVTLLGSLVLLYWTASCRRTAVRSMTLIGAIGAWSVSVILGLMLVLTVWRATYPIIVEQIVMIMNEMLAHLSAVIIDML
jgi:hypothetical protein